MSALHPFQEALVRECAIAFRSHRAVLMQLGTGGGKTHTAAEIIARFLARGEGRRVLFLADLDAILADTVARLRAAGLHVGLVQADRPADPTAPVQVASLQTLAVRPESLPAADLVIFDECHGAPSITGRAVLERYPTALILGLTATPQRGDGQPLGDLFETMVQGPSNAWLTANGYLVPLSLVGPPALGRGLACSPVEAYQRWCTDRRAVVFCRSVSQARSTAAEFTAAGINAECVTGQSSRRVRDGLRARIEDGTTRVVTGVNVFRKGWDCPVVDAAIFACNVGVASAWLQMLGRVSRTAPRKTDAIAVDLCGSWVQLGLRDDERAWSLSGEAHTLSPKLPPAQRCTECAAVFSPAARCPRCGAAHQSIERVVRVLSRADKLALVSHLSPAERDARYLESLRRVAEGRMRLDPKRAEQWARSRFEATRGRKPEVAA